MHINHIFLKICMHKFVTSGFHDLPLEPTVCKFNSQTYVSVCLHTPFSSCLQMKILQPLPHVKFKALSFLKSSYKHTLDISPAIGTKDNKF